MEPTAQQLETLKKKIEDDIKVKAEYKQQEKSISKIFYQLKTISINLDIKNSDEIKYVSKQATIDILLKALTQSTESLILLMKSKLHFGIDPLARVTLEYAVNLIYLIDDNKNIKNKQLLKHYFDDTLKKSKRWYESAVDNNDKDEIHISKTKMDFIQELKDEHHVLYNDDTLKKWPNAHDRFLACGLKSSYRTLYAMNSDSVHSLSEDVYNFNTIPNYPIELQETMEKYFLMSNASLSVYHILECIRFYSMALQNICILLKNNEDLTRINNLVIKLEPLLEFHKDEVVEAYS